MRTTLQVDDKLVWDIKRKAQEEGVSFSKMLNQVLRLGLQNTDISPPFRGGQQDAIGPGDPSLENLPDS